MLSSARCGPARRRHRHRATFADLGQTIAEIFGGRPLAHGTSVPSRDPAMPNRLREQLEEREHEILAPQAAKSAEPRPAAAGAGRSDPSGLPARSRPRHSLQGVPPAQAQDAGVLRADRGPLPHAPDPHARGVADRAQHRQGAAPQRRADRGDRARPRPRPSAVRPCRRARPRPARPGGFNHYEQSLRIVDVLENDRQGLNLTWEVRDGIARHSKANAAAVVGADPQSREHDRGADRARRRHHRLRQSRHRRCGAGRYPARGDAAAVARRGAGASARRAHWPHGHRRLMQHR